ncbi:hypothetical protein I3760_07G132800 [Carya illinoinensis]|nr:hypothetical protein I3760_07G132800 [Carya illinoinensis]
MGLEEKNGSFESSVQPSFDDQHFVLNFIMSTCFGPDVKSDNPRYSAAQRLIKGLAPYTLSDLGASYVSISLLERLYYYILRNANPGLVLKPNMLHMYIKGNLPSPSPGSIEERKHFTSIFPLNLHKQIWFPASFRIVKGIVLIDDPIIAHMKEEDLERFKYLSSLDNLKIDMDEALCYKYEYHTGNGNGEQNCMNGSMEAASEYTTNGNGDSPVRFQQKCKRRHRCDPQSMPAFPHVVPISKHQSKRRTLQRTNKLDGPVMMPLLSIPNVEDCNSPAAIVLTGTARGGIVGPPVGTVDIGISKDAYLFRVALPGVKKDNCQFSCEVECNGKVHLRGITSGGKTIKKRCRVFEMEFQQLCPPGPFTLSFSLPGPVDPRLFAPNFRSDGIFEAVILKQG